MKIMKKKLFVLCLAICVLFAISSVCAADVNDTALAGTDNQQELSQDPIDDNSIEDNILKSKKTDEIITAGVKDFTSLNADINGNNDSDIYLKSEYKYNSTSDTDFKNGIRIEREVTIHGNGHTIDGSKAARMFSANSNVIFKDIFFINGKGYDAGAITGGTAINCTFDSNTASRWGGATYSTTAINCTFNSNKAETYGGAMYYGTAINCTFISNKSFYHAGAIYQGSAENCTFISNTASERGGALYYSTAVNCTFKSNSAGTMGGAMNNGNALRCTFESNKANVGGSGGATAGTNVVDCTFTSNVAVSGGAMSGGSATNCIFKYNSASSGGAISNGGAVNCSFYSNSASNGGAMDRCSATNCNFTNNRASSSGGAMYSGAGKTYPAENCRFINNTAKEGGATYQIAANNCEFIENTATNYGGAMYIGTVSNCVFRGNKAGISGNDTYQTVYPKATLKVSDFTSTYRSGDRLMFNLTTDDGKPIGNANITIRVYKDNDLLATYYALSGEGWIVDIDAGNYIASCSVENQQYRVNQANATLTVNKADSTVSLTEVVYNVGDFGRSVATVTGAINITASVNGHSEAVINITGNVITVSGLNFGDYILKVTTVPDANHNSVSNTTSVTVNKEDSSVVLTPVVFDYEGCGTSTATLANAVNMTAVVVDHDEAVISITGNEITVSGLNAGTYTLKVTTIPEKYYSAVSNTTSITVNRLNSSVSVNPVEFDYNSIGSTQASFTNATGVTAEVVGQPKAIVNVEGNAISVSNLDAGTYTLKVTTITDANHNPATGTANITVNTVQTQLTASGVTTTYNVNKDLIITLKDDKGNPLSGAEISVDLNGVKHYTTDKNGQVRVDVSRLVPKTYTAKITVSQSKNYITSSASATVTVKKATPKLTAKAKTFKKSVKTKKYTITLKDNRNRAIKNAKVTIKVNKKTYTAKTNAKGKATFKIKNLKKKGTFKSTVTYKGDKYYSKATKKVKIKVK